MIIKDQRNLNPLQFAWKALAGAPQVMRCAHRFKNWNSVVGQYVRPSSFVESSIATGRENFEIQLWEPSDVQTVWAVFCNCNYQVPEAPAVVLDLGANIGTFSIYAAKVKHAKRIIALEPVASTFAKLQKNISANGLDSIVTCVQQGIGAAPGTRTIYKGTSSPHSSMYFRGDPKFESGQTETIEITTLQSLLDRFNLSSVDVCKADCEGGEVEALLGASDEVLRKIRLITMEYHFPGNISDKSAFFGRLERAGFELAWHSSVGKMATFVRK